VPRRRKWSWPTICAAISGIAAVLSAYFAYLTWDLSRHEQRPLVGPPTSIKAVIAPDSSVNFWQVFKNVGHSPTTALFIDATIKPNWTYSADDLLQVCAIPDERVTAPEHNTFSLLPGSEWSIDSANLPTFLESKLRFTVEGLRKMLKPNVLGCVAYLWRFDNVVHHTAYYAGINVKGQTITFPYIYAANSN